MTPYLLIEDLTKSYGDRILFESVTFGVNEGDKIGIIAKNGTGKTTLLRIIAGKESADSGKIVQRNDLKVGILEQQPELEPGVSVLEACLIGDSPAVKAIKEYESAMASGDTDRINNAVHEMDRLAAWDYEDNMRQMLQQLNISNLEAITDTLSGGQRKRVALAKILLDHPDLIILDEPTNHLDIDIVEWLEAYLTRQRVTLLMVTHDRYFLNRVCNKIIEIDRRHIYTYPGNYNEYLRRRAERIEALEGELARAKNTLRKEQEWMSRQPQARAGKARYRINQFYDLKERASQNYTERNVNLDVRSSYIGSKIFEARGINKRWGDKVILDDFNYTFARYEKLGIIGRNGVGKSTFIKMLLGLVTPDSGTWDIGTTIRFGYYSQDGISLPKGKKVIDAITAIAEDIEIKEGIHLSPMQFLQRFLFSPADQQKYVETLSGGELCRLHLATVLMRQPNFLILDEPTNDLDIVTLGILEEYLREFNGCVIVISHDRFFLDSIADHLFVFEGGGVIKDFPGNYTEYRQWRTEKDLEEKQAQATAAKPAPTVKPVANRTEKMTFKERKEFEALDAEIEQLTAEKTELDRLFASGSVIADIEARLKRYEEIRELLDEKEMRWLELSEKA